MEKKIPISYNKEADVMYLIFGEPVKAEAEQDTGDRRQVKILSLEY